MYEKFQEVILRFPVEHDTPKSFHTKFWHQNFDVPDGNKNVSNWNKTCKKLLKDLALALILACLCFPFFSIIPCFFSYSSIIKHGVSSLSWERDNLHSFRVIWLVLLSSFSKDLAENISRSMTLNYLNETNIMLLMFPLDTFTLPLEKSKSWGPNCGSKKHGVTLNWEA